MTESKVSDRLRGILGSDGAWLVPVLALTGVAATFFSFGWLGALIFVILLLVLLLAVFMRAALRVQTGTAVEDPDPQSTAATKDLEARHPSPSPAMGEEAGTPSTATGAEGDDVDEGEKSTFQRGLDAALEGDVEGAREALDEWIAEESETAEVLSRTALKELALVRAGDSGALERLRRLADENDRHADVQHTFASALAAQGAVGAAADEVSARIEGIQDRAGRAELKLSEARFRVQLGQLDVGKTLCRELLDTDAAFEAAVELAKIAADEGNVVLSLAFYEKAVSIDPTNVSARFQLAYAASEADLDELSVLHYGILERNDSATSVTINNLGVSLAERGAIGLSRSYWKRASQMGSALAAGNLANAAVDAGFLDEAQAFAEAANDEDESPRVGEALSRIAQMRADDRVTRTDLERDGRTMSVALGKALDSTSPAIPAGKWSVEGTEWEFTETAVGSEASRGNGVAFRFFLDEGVLRFEHEPGTFAPARSGFAVPAPNGDGLLLVVVGASQSNNRLEHARPVQNLT